MASTGGSHPLQETGLSRKQEVLEGILCIFGGTGCGLKFSQKRNGNRNGSLHRTLRAAKLDGRVTRGRCTVKDQKAKLIRKQMSRETLPGAVGGVKGIKPIRGEGEAERSTGGSRSLRSDSQGGDPRFVCDSWPPREAPDGGTPVAWAALKSGNYNNYGASPITRGPAALSA